MEIQPLPKKLFDKAKSMGVTKISLEFQGGSDEGYLNVYLKGSFEDNFDDEVEEWAWNAYEYSGAGDGDRYGDNIVYDLANGKAEADEWYMVCQEGERSEIELVVEDDQ